MAVRTNAETAARTAVVHAPDDAIPTRIPQPHGGALLPGGVPGNKGGTGRPRSEVRLAALEGAGTAIPRLRGIVTDPGAATRDVIAAARVLLEFGVGRHVELEDATLPEKPTFDQAKHRMAEILPAMLRGPFFTLADLLSFRDAIDDALKRRAVRESHVPRPGS